MSKNVTIEINAKVNLSLNIVGNKDGYHMLDTVVASVGIADAVSACKSDAFSLSFTNKKINISESNAFKSAVHMSEKYRLPKVSIKITNNIPCGCGLGGSSADCAGVIASLNKLFSLGLTDDELREEASLFGSDTAYMLSGGYARLRGRGEQAEFFRSGFSPRIMIAYGGEVSTKDCFSAYDKMGAKGELSDNDALVKYLIDCNRQGIYKEAKNALTQAAESLNPFITTIKNQLSGFPYVMTGSGAGIAVFVNDEILRVRLEQAGAKVIQTEILPSP